MREISGDSGGTAEPLDKTNGHPLIHAFPLSSYFFPLFFFHWLVEAQSQSGRTLEFEQLHLAKDNRMNYSVGCLHLQ